jgi:uroporphyrinogen decarboxylase
MTDRERFVACLAGQPVDRAPYWLMWGPWGTAWRRWEREGKPADLADYGAVRRLFDADACPAGVPVKCGPCPAFEWRKLAEDAESVTFVDSWGIERRNLKSHESMSEFIRFPVRNRDEWERYRRERLDPQHPGRLAGPWRERCREWTAQGVPIQLGNYPDATVYGGLRWLLGDEE